MRTFINYFIKGFLRFNGRANRKEYISVILPFLILCTITNQVYEYFYNQPYILWFLDFIVMCGFLVYLALTNRRLHDLNVSGVWQLLLLLFPGSQIGLFFFKGNHGPNKFGEEPK